MDRIEHLFYSSTMAPGEYSYPTDLDWRPLLARFRCGGLGHAGRCQLFVNHGGACAHASLQPHPTHRTRRGHPLNTKAVLVRWSADGGWSEDLDEWRGVSHDRLPWCCMFGE